MGRQLRRRPAGGAYIVFYVCAHQYGGLNCLRVPHRPAGVRDSLPASLELFGEVDFPGAGQGRQVQDAVKLLSGERFRGHDPRELRDGHSRAVWGFNLPDRIACRERAFLKDPEVETVPPAVVEQLGEIGLPKRDSQLEAGEARLGHQEARRADFQFVADGNLSFCQFIDRQILSESAGIEIIALQRRAPVLHVFPGVHIHGFVGTAVHGEVGLKVSLKIQRPDFDRPGHRFFENSGLDTRAVRGDNLRQADIHGKNFHGFRPSARARGGRSL